MDDVCLWCRYEHPCTLGLKHHAHWKMLACSNSTYICPFWKPTSSLFSNPAKTETRQMLPLFLGEWRMDLDMCCVWNLMNPFHRQLKILINQVQNSLHSSYFHQSTSDIQSVLDITPSKDLTCPNLLFKPGSTYPPSNSLRIFLNHFISCSSGTLNKR